MPSQQSLLNVTFERIRQDKIDAYTSAAAALGFSIVQNGKCDLCAASSSNQGCALKHAFGQRFTCSDIDACIMGDASRLDELAAFITTLQ